MERPPDAQDLITLLISGATDNKSEICILSVDGDWAIEQKVLECKHFGEQSLINSMLANADRSQGSQSGASNQITMRKCAQGELLAVPREANQFRARRLFEKLKTLRGAMVATTTQRVVYVILPSSDEKFLWMSLRLLRRIPTEPQWSKFSGTVSTKAMADAFGKAFVKQRTRSELVDHAFRKLEKALSAAGDWTSQVAAAASSRSFSALHETLLARATSMLHVAPTRRAAELDRRLAVRAQRYACCLPTRVSRSPAGRALVCPAPSDTNGNLPKLPDEVPSARPKAVVAIQEFRPPFAAFRRDTPFWRAPVEGTRSHSKAYGEFSTPVRPTSSLCDPVHNSTSSRKRKRTSSYSQSSSKEARSDCDEKHDQATSHLSAEEWKRTPKSLVNALRDQVRSILERYAENHRPANAKDVHKEMLKKRHKIDVKRVRQLAVQCDYVSVGNGYLAPLTASPTLIDSLSDEAKRKLQSHLKQRRLTEKIIRKLLEKKGVVRVSSVMRVCDKFNVWNGRKPEVAYLYRVLRALRLKRDRRENEDGWIADDVQQTASANDDLH